MREIKYNVVTQDNKYLKSDQYHHIKEIHYASGGTTVSFIIWADYQGDDDWTFHKSDNPKLISPTGLKDKNGVEIYEGDIVKWDDGDDWETGREKVTYKNGAFNIACFVSVEEGYIDEPRIIEVIGNIYENPELIKN